MDDYTGIYPKALEAVHKISLLQKRAGKSAIKFYTKSLKYAISVGRIDIAAVLVKNGIAFMQKHLNHLRYDWEGMFNIEVRFANALGFKCEKDEMLRTMWELLICAWI